MVEDVCWGITVRMQFFKINKMALKWHEMWDTTKGDISNFASKYFRCLIRRWGKGNLNIFSKKLILPRWIENCSLKIQDQVCWKFDSYYEAKICYLTSKKIQTCILSREKIWHVWFSLKKVLSTLGISFRPKKSKFFSKEKNKNIVLISSRFFFVFI